MQIILCISLVCKSEVGANSYSVLDVEILPLSEPGKLIELFVSVFKTLVYDEFCSYVLNGENYSKNMTESDMSSTDTVWEFSPKTDEQISDVNRIICNYMIGQAKYSFYFYN